MAYVPATPEPRSRGLLGYIECSLNGGVRISGLTLRRTIRGVYSISFPLKPGREFRRWYVTPLDAASRQDIERQILGELRRRGEIP